MRWLEYIVSLVLVLGLANPLGLYLARVCERQHTFMDRVLRPVESMLYCLLGVDPEREMSARAYVFSFVLFGLCNTIVLFLILVFQRWLPGGRLFEDAHDPRPGGEYRSQFRNHDDVAGLRW